MSPQVLPQMIPATGTTTLPPDRAVLIVDLDAIADNWRSLNTVTNKAETAAVVKANAYGLGMKEVVQRLVQEGCRTFFVALPQEALNLRNTIDNYDINIVCLNGLCGQAEMMIEKDIIPVINNHEDLSAWTLAARESGHRLPAVFHFDTGLNRLGFNMSDAETIAQDNKWQQHLDLVLIMSHLACADEPDHPLTDIQNWRFQRILENFPDIPASLAASDGIFRGASKHYDLVRPGIALYGGNPTPERGNPMKSAVTLTAPILQIRTADQDGTVGYGATRNISKGQRLATIAYGYADGLFRSTSNKAQFYYDGHVLPVLGRISMDVTVVDISEVPEGELEVGDHIVVLGQYQSLEDLARPSGTISYELLTALGNRFERHYVTKKNNPS